METEIAVAWAVETAAMMEICTRDKMAIMIDDDLDHERTALILS